MAYDIFISYRRDGGKELARPLKSELERRGYRVFLDFDELKDGVFDRRIMEAIDSSPIFMVVLSPHALDRCVNDDDWVRREIEYAMKHDRHIVPVNPDLTFDGFPDGLPEALKSGLGQHQFSEVMFGQLFMASVDKMVSDRIEPLLSRLGRAADAEKQKQAGALFHVEADMECRMLKFGREIAVARPGDDVTIRLPKGRHKLEFVSTECPDDRLSILHTVEDNEMEDILSVELLPVREKRLQEERERREAEERHRNEEEVIRQQTAFNIEMVYVDGGAFTMGALDSDSDAYDDEKPAHKVTLSNYHIGKYEITQKQWEEIMDYNPSRWKGDILPVDRVNWNDTQQFISKLNAKTGKNYRLPTEAEWEFAARGGNNSKGYKYSGSNNLDDIAWYNANSGDETHAVGSKLPNELGIYDMTGNVCEWCHDSYDQMYYLDSPSLNPTSASSGIYRVLRGGGWNSDARHSRISCRHDIPIDLRSCDFGFRLVLPQPIKIYKIGDYYNENGREGVVFEVDATGHYGKIVSMKQSSNGLQWCTLKKYENKFITSETNGMKNMQTIMHIDSWREKYPAFAWCAEQGDGWYLPAIEELKKFTLDDAVHDAVNRTLSQHGGDILFDKMDSKWYWSSSEYNEFCAKRVYMYGGYTGNYNKNNDFFVRAVFAF